MCEDLQVLVGGSQAAGCDMVRTGLGPTQSLFPVDTGVAGFTKQVMRGTEEIEESEADQSESTRNVEFTARNRGLRRT